MTATVLLALFGVGLAVGFLSGLVGIGGGVLIVPFLYFFYAYPEWSGTWVSPEMEAAVAHATSLFIIVPTAVKGTIAYHRSGRVAWGAVLPIAVTSVVAAVLGARLALLLPAELLKLAFGALLVVSGVRMVRGRPAGRPHSERRTLLRGALTGLFVGLLSALLGVGGGLVAIPLLIHVVGLELDQVSATSLAIVAFAATAGMLTYVASGWGVAGLPAGSLGYVHVLAAVPMLAGSLLAVGWGASTNQRLAADRLRWIFAVLFVAMGVRLIIANIGILI